MIKLEVLLFVGLAGPVALASPTAENSSASATRSSLAICPADITWRTEKDRVPIDSFHLSLICGDRENPAWQKVPFYQAEFHLKAYLQSQGYFAPDIEFKDSGLSVSSGPKLRFQRMILEPEIKSWRYDLSFYERRLLTPELLNLLESRSKLYFRNQGHACVGLKSQVIIETGEIHITAEPKEIYHFGIVNREKVPDVDDRVFDRYLPFAPDDVFSNDEIELAKKRVLRDGIVQGTYFTENCKVSDKTAENTDIPFLDQNFILSSPRTLRFGVGFNSEEGPFGQASWEHDRYGHRATHLEASTYASLERQNIQASARFYPTLEKPRFFLAPEFSLKRDSSKDLVEVENTLALKPGYQWDRLPWMLNVKAGPAFVVSWYHEKTSGAPPLRDGSVALQAQIVTETHAYEYYDAHAQAGFFMANNFDFRHPALGFFTPTLNWTQSAKYITHLGHCLRAQCYLAFRHQMGLTFIKNPQENILRLPSDLRTYLGDVVTLRGFKTGRLPNPGLTMISEGIETRFSGLGLASLEPFIFVDAGKLGYRSFTLTNETFMAPGLGLRWFSPIGIVNGFVTRSLALKHTIENQWYFYIGLGDAF